MMKVMELGQKHQFNECNLKQFTNTMKNFPQKKKAKEALPEIGAVNTWRKTLVFRDIKKNTSKFVERFKNIGLVDACGHS